MDTDLDKNKKNNKTYLIILIIISCAAIFLSAALFWKYKKLQKSINSTVAYPLNGYEHLTQAFRSDKVKIIYEHFISLADNTTQGYTVLLPENYDQNKKYKLIYFFHGMDGDSADTTILLQLAENEQYIIAGGNFRGPSWGNSQANSDMVQLWDILTKQYNIKDTVLFGVSMGGTQVFTLGTNAPERIKNNLAGIISYMGSTDYTDTYYHTSLPRITNTIKESFGGDPLQKEESYRQMSAVNNLDAYTPGLPFAIIYRSADTYIPTRQQEEMIGKLTQAGHPIFKLKLPGEHLFESVNYEEILNFIYSHSTPQAI